MEGEVDSKCCGDPEHPGTEEAVVLVPPSAAGTGEPRGGGGGGGGGAIGGGKVKKTIKKVINKITRSPRNSQVDPPPNVLEVEKAERPCLISPNFEEAVEKEVREQMGRWEEERRAEWKAKVEDLERERKKVREELEKEIQEKDSLAKVLEEIQRVSKERILKLEEDCRHREEVERLQQGRIRDLERKAEELVNNDEDEKVCGHLRHAREKLTQLLMAEAQAEVEIKEMKGQLEMSDTACASSSDGEGSGCLWWKRLKGNYLILLAEKAQLLEKLEEQDAHLQDLQSSHNEEMVLVEEKAMILKVKCFNITSLCDNIILHTYIIIQNERDSLEEEKSILENECDILKKNDTKLQVTISVNVSVMIIS